MHSRFHPAAKRAAYSLIELSIVLTALAILAGSITIGKSMVHSAQLRSITTEFQRYSSSARAFKEKYNYLPGDMPNANLYWGQSSTVTCPGTSTVASVGTGTCNGNGDGKVWWCSDIGSGIYTCPETFGFWQQLALSHMFIFLNNPGSPNNFGATSNYTGFGISSPTDREPGLNVPASQYASLTWGVANMNLLGTTSNYYYALDYGNFLFFGVPGTALYGSNLLSGEDAALIDSKMDDGKPGSGMVIGGGLPSDGSCAWCGNAAKTNVCTTSASSTDYGGTYRIGNTDQVCFLMFVKAF